MRTPTPSEKLAALNKELMEILNHPRGPMRAEMPRLMQIEDEIREAKAEEFWAEMAKKRPA